jgi:hypothetical protein
VAVIFFEKLHGIIGFDGVDSVDDMNHRKLVDVNEVRSAREWQ